MKVSIFAVLLVLYLSVCGAFAQKRTKCSTQKGAAITSGTVIKTWNWMSSDPADERVTWKQCKSRCQVYGDCKGWSYQSSRFGGGCSIYSKVKKYKKNYKCMCTAYAGKCK